VVRVAYCLGGIVLTRWPCRDADCVPPSVIGVENAWSFMSTPLYVHGVVFN
jgi:hypothetical protein